MRSLIFLVLLGCLGILFAQNLQPVSLVFFGFYKTMPLPLAVWLLSFLLAGLFTSVLGQTLSNFSSQKTRTTVNRSESRSPDKAESKPSQSQKVKEKVFPREENKIEDDEWDIEQPPKKSRETEAPEAVRDEGAQQPKTTYRSGSVYSYSYRDTDGRKDGATDEIYDANYRVIKPPLRENKEDDTEQPEEDWI